MGTGTVDADSFDNIKIPAKKGNMTLEVGKEAKRAATQLKGLIVDEGLEELKDEIIRIRQDYVTLNRIIKPLTAITDLSVHRRKPADSAKFSEGELSAPLSMSETEKNRVLDNLNPMLVLNHLAEFINSQELTNKRI